MRSFFANITEPYTIVVLNVITKSGNIDHKVSNIAIRSKLEAKKKTKQLNEIMVC